MPTNDSNNQQKPQNQFNGLLTCAKYAFMPNKLQYCGGDNNQQLFEYSANNFTDPGLNNLLQEFQTLYPYLKLIASSNNISDIFDYRVVEAYWIGNQLLSNVNMNKLYWHFIDGLNLKKKINLNNFEKIVGKIPQGALPHHSFHVLNIYFRTGNLPVEHTLETMNNCIINWGKIIEIKNNELIVETPQINYLDNKLILSAPIKKTITYKWLDKSFINSLETNDIITYHWDWACDKITSEQQKSLDYYTRLSLSLANNTT